MHILFGLDLQKLLEGFCSNNSQQALSNQTQTIKDLQSANWLHLSLRGGGCIIGSNNKIHDPQNLGRSRKVLLPDNFTSNLENYSESINQNSRQILNNDKREELLIAIQWFIYNKYYINLLARDEVKANQHQEIILQSVQQIILSIPILIKTSCFLCHEVLQILNDLLRFLFIRKKNFQIKSKLQDKFLHQLILAEDQIQGSSIQIWETGIKFELQMAKLAVEKFQTREGQEIGENLMQQLVYSVLTQNITEGLLDSIFNLGRYLFKQAQAKLAEKQYEFYFFFEQLKWNIIELLLEGNTNTTLLQMKLSKAYEENISKSKNWMPHFCWVKMLSDLISYRPLVYKKKLFKGEDNEKQDRQWIIERNTEFIRVSSYDYNFGTVIFNKQELKDIYIQYRKIDQFQQFLMLECSSNKQQKSFKTLLDYAKLTFKYDEQEYDYRDLINFLLFENPNIELLKSNINYLCDLNGQNKDLETKILQEQDGQGTQTSPENDDYQKKPLELISENFLTMTILFQEIFIQAELYQQQVFLVRKLISVIPPSNNESDNLYDNTKLENLNKLQCDIIQNSSVQIKQRIQDANQYTSICISNLKEHVKSFENQQKELNQQSDIQGSHNDQNVNEFPTILRKIFNFKIYQNFVTIICEKYNQLNNTQNQREILPKQIKLLQLLFKVIQQIQKRYSKVNKWIQTMNDDENNLQQLIEQKKQQQNIEQIQLILSYFREEQDEIKSLKLSSRESIDQSKKDEFKTLIQKNKEKIEKSNLNQNQNKKYLLTFAKIQILLTQITPTDYIEKIDEIINIYDQSIQQNTSDLSSIFRQRTTMGGKQIPCSQTINFTNIETQMSGFMDKIKIHIEYLQNFDDYLKNKDTVDGDIEDRKYLEYHKNNEQNFKTEFINNITKQEYYEVNPQSNLGYQLRQVASFLKHFAISLSFKYSVGNEDKFQELQKTQFRNQKINGQDYSSDYRVRECLFFCVMKIQNIIKEPKVIELCQIIIQQLWMVEKNESVRNIFKDKEMIQEQKKLYSHELHTFTQKVKSEFKEKLSELQKLESEIRQEGLQSDKIELTLKLQEKYKEFQEYLNNIDEMTQQVNLSFVFLTEIHKDLQNLQRKIDKLQASVDDIFTDVRQLRGKTYKELLIMRRNKVLREQQIANMNSIYIKLKTNRRTYNQNNNRYNQEKCDESNTRTLLQEEENEDTDARKQAEVNKFLDQDKKCDIMLIRGQAGSGKSRAAKKIEEYIWKRHQRNPQDWIPIFISLPSLKDPTKNLFNEAMESDYYHFDRIQIRELKDAISNERERVVLILDSYDELKNDVKNKNLYQTNDIAQQFNVKNGDKNLKIIITTRSELLQDKNFASWFVGSDIRDFIDVELQQFQQEEIDDYLNKYSHLSVKNKIFGLYEYVQQIEGKKVDPEEVKLIQSKIEPFLNQATTDNESNYTLLNSHKVKNIIDKIKLLPYFLNLREEQVIKLEKELLELWSQQKYKDSIYNLKIDNILQTPYMMEIVVQVLPNFAKTYSEAAQIKDLFKKNFLAIKQSENNSKLIIEKYKSHIRDLQLIQVDNDEPESQLKQLLKTMDEIRFFQNFSILNNLNQINTYPGLEQQQRNAIISSYRQKIFTTYEFYENFINFYHSQQMIKQQRLGNVSNFEVLRIDLWAYAESLALEMTLNDQTYFTHQVSGVLKLQKVQEIREPDKYWPDKYFDGTEQEQQYKKLIKSCILLTCKGNVYSFTHKSIQEFFAAKYVINLFTDYFEKKKLSEEDFKKSLYNNDKFNISKSSFQKISEFIINYFQGREQIFVNQLIQISKLSLEKENLVRSASNSLFLLSQFKAYLGYQNLKNLNISDTKINGLSFYKSDLSKSKFTNVEIDGCNFNLAKIEDADWKIICKEQRTISEHKSKVTALAMSNDGKRLYSATFEGEIICWDYAQRTKSKSTKHNEKIHNLIISPDGEFLATNGISKTITLWNSETLKNEELQEKHTDQVSSISFLQDKTEKWLASGSNDSTILLWNYEIKQTIKQPLKHKNKVMQVMFFPNSKQLASSCLDNCIRIWNIEQEPPQVVQIFLDHDSELRSIGVSTDGSYLLAGYKYKQEQKQKQQDEACVRAWEIQKKSSQRELKIQKPKHIFSLAIYSQSEMSTNKKSVIVAGSEDVIFYWYDDQEENELQQQGSVEALAFVLTKNQIQLFSASEIEIKIWNYQDNFSEINRLIVNIGSPTKLGIIDNKYLVFRTKNKNVYCIDYQKKQNDKEIQNSHKIYHDNEIQTLLGQENIQEIEIGHSYIICGGDDESIYIIVCKEIKESDNPQVIGQKQFNSFCTLEEYGDEENPPKGIKCLALSSNEEFLASADKNQMIYLFETKEWELIQKFDTQKIVTSLSFIPNKTLLAFGCDDKTLILWDREKESIIDQFVNHSGQISMMQSSSDGSSLIYRISGQGSQEKISVISFQIPQKSFKGIRSDVIQIITSPNDQKILGIGQDQQIKIWDLESEKIKPSPITYKVDLTSAIINSDNNLITGQENGDIIIWNMINEDENKPMDGQIASSGHSGYINSLYFSPDGLNLVSCCEDQIFVWDLQKNKNIDLAQQDSDMQKTQEIQKNNQDQQDTQIKKIKSVMYFPNYPEEQLLLLKKEKEILIWNLIQRKVIISKKTDNVITAIEIIEESQKVVYCLEDGNILIWDKNGQVDPRTLEKKHDQKINSISSKFDGELLVFGSDDCKISIWKKKQDQLYEFQQFIEDHKNKVKVVLFTPDGQSFASGDSKGVIYIWSTDAFYHSDVHTEQYNCEIVAMAFSEDGKILATGYVDKCIKIWKVNELKLIQTIQRENGNLGSISFSIDGKLAYSFGSDISLCEKYVDKEQNTEYIAYQNYTKNPLLQAEKCQIKNSKIFEATDQNQSFLELFMQKKAIILQ